jgi:amino acid transporter
VQVGQTVPGGTDTTALDMWPGLFFAFVLAFLTTMSYSELARIFPEAGTGSCYYFAEKAFMDKENVQHHRWARLAKLVTGWAAHLFYWVYPLGCARRPYAPLSQRERESAMLRCAWELGSDQSAVGCS